MSDPAAPAPPLALAPPPEQPRPVLHLEYAPAPAAAHPAWRALVRITVPLALPWCVISLLAILQRVESVVLTGPVLIAVGVLTLLGGLFTADRLAAFIGGCHCLVCLLLFSLVITLGWSPAQARTPFLAIGTAYTLALAGPTVYAAARRRP